MRRFALLTALLAVCACAVGINASAAMALSPAVETLPASPVGEEGATLKGTVNPNGGETKAYFEYGTTTSYGSKTAEANLGSGTTVLEHSQAISSLSANTLYHYRVVATNPSGSSQGVDKTFTTVGSPAISGLTSTPETKSGESATLKASVDPNGQSTTYQFEYGKSSGSYTNVVPVPAESAGSGYESVSGDVNITGLTPGTRYFWRVSATNASGKVSSSEASFISSAHPSFQVTAPTEITRSSASLNAVISWSTKHWFEYGTTTSYGSKTAVKEQVTFQTPVSMPVSGLKANTLYHYRLVAENSSGTHASADYTFTTLPAATLYPTSGGEQLKLGAALKTYSTNFTFTGESGVHSCGETEFTGELLENPGAQQWVWATRFQTGGTKCVWKSGYYIVYTFPSKGMTMDLAKDGTGEGVVTTGSFTYVATTYLGGFKLAECEYGLSLTGTFKTTTALEPTLSGKTTVIKGNSACPGAESVSGKFAVTSGGGTVEAR